jgi:hypothetical protein
VTPAGLPDFHPETINHGGRLKTAYHKAGSTSNPLGQPFPAARMPADTARQHRKRICLPGWSRLLIFCPAHIKHNLF